MSAVKKFRVKSKIASLVFNNTGPDKVGEALARADEKIAELREGGLVALDACLAEMSSRFGATARPRESDLSQLYALSGRIIDVGVHVPDSGVPEAALSLCELVDRLSDKGPDWKAIDVHLGALQMLRAHGPSLGAEQRGKVIGGLRDVVFKLSSAAPA